MAENTPKRFGRYDAVYITYPNSARARREALVVEDDGGPTVTVEWASRIAWTRKGIKGYHTGGTHTQRIPRERIQPRKAIR